MQPRFQAAGKDAGACLPDSPGIPNKGRTEILLAQRKVPLKEIFDNNPYTCLPNSKTAGNPGGQEYPQAQRRHRHHRPGVLLPHRILDNVDFSDERLLHTRSSSTSSSGT